MRHLVLALLLIAAPAAAFPDRPITIVLPYSPGSAADGYARAMGEHFQRVLGQPSVITNRDYALVPIAREQGIDAEQLSQVGLYAPRGTPEPVLAQLEAACRTGTEDATFRRVAATTRVVVNFMPRAAFTAMVQVEHPNYGRILRELGVAPE